VHCTVMYCTALYCVPLFSQRVCRAARKGGLLPRTRARGSPSASLPSGTPARSSLHNPALKLYCIVLYSLPLSSERVWRAARPDELLPVRGRGLHPQRPLQVEPQQGAGGVCEHCRALRGQLRRHQQPGGHRGAHQPGAPSRTSGPRRSTSWRRYPTLLYCTVLYYTVLYCTVLYCTVLYCTVLCCAVLCCDVLWCAVRCCTALYCAVLCCPVLCCTMLYLSLLC